MMTLVEVVPSAMAPHVVACDARASDEQASEAVLSQPMQILETVAVECPEMQQEDYSTLPRDLGRANSVIRFVDGSLWKIKGSLSNLKYQQEHPPFEARQVFACVCLEDPEDRYIGRFEEAVLKVKYQVEGSLKAIKYYEDLVEECTKDLNQNRADAAEDLQYAQKLLYAATHPVTEPNEYTEMERDALEVFLDKRCYYTPVLLGFEIKILQQDTVNYQIDGGFAACTLMTKVPGQCLSSGYYWSLSPSKREEVREGFKKAFINVWILGFYPQDHGLRNLMWDDAEGVCYIVDWEDYTVYFMDATDKFEDYMYELWGLSERGNPNPENR